MEIVNILIFISILILIIVIFHLSHKEMRKSKKVLQIKLDESTRALRESRLIRMNELARSAEFGRLAQGLVHDLVTPLTSIILHTEKLKKDGTQKNVEKAVEAGNRMAGYIKDIRTTLSHEESDRHCILSEELDVVLKLLSYNIKTRNIEVSVTKDDLCVWYGNPVKLRQIFSNLISNAIDSFDSLKNREKKIQISIYETGEEVTVGIQDNGCGISAQNIEKIFDPFFTTKPTDKGTGIGLATVKSIVEKDLKGTIEVESEEDAGTLVRIRYTNPVACPPLPHTPLPLE